MGGDFRTNIETQMCLSSHVLFNFHWLFVKHVFVEMIMLTTSFWEEYSKVCKTNLILWQSFAKVMRVELISRGIVASETRLLSRARGSRGLKVFGHKLLF